MTQTLVARLLHRPVTPLSIQAVPVAFEWWKPSRSVPDRWACLSQQSSKRWAQLLFLLTAKIINRARFFLPSPLYKPTKASDAFSFTSNKKGRSRSKAPNWSLPYLSDRWIVHCSFTDPHASQHIPCGILRPRLQAVSSLFNYSWNQLFFRNPWR